MRKSCSNPVPWWGEGLAPHLEWPGSTIEIPCVWRGSRWESPDGKWFFDTAAADKACRFFPEMLRHYSGHWAGKPFTLLPYQTKLLTRPIFGWKSTVTGLRRFRRVFAFLPKGAGKSPWSSGTGLYLQLCDDEAAAQVYCVAADRQQARTIHDNAKIFIEQSPELSEACEVQRDSIYCASNRSIYRVLSSDAKTAHGVKPHAILYDELHAAEDRDLFEALKKSMVKRTQPLLIITTHAGTDDDGICHEEYDYAKGVLSGTIPDPSCLPVIFEMQRGDDWTDPETWARCNPAHGILVQHDAIAAECLEAQFEPRKLNDFLRFHLNVWTNQATAWIPAEWWDNCTPVLPSDAELRTLPVSAGLDMAQKYDLAAFVLTFRRMLPNSAATVVLETEEGEPKSTPLNYELLVLPHFWIPRETLEQHERNDGVPYSDWVRRGFVTATEGSIIDYSRVHADILKIASRFPALRQGQTAYDPAFATDIAQKLMAAGFMMVECPQNATTLSEPSHVFEALLKAGRVVHDGNRCMRWNVENAAIKTDAGGRIRPVKPRSPSKRIDGLVAAIMGLSRAMIHKPEKEYRIMFI